MQVPVISIVDDDESFRRATTNFVRSLGYTAATFASAEEFLQADAAGRSDCLITDLQMPGTNGIEFFGHSFIADPFGRLLADAAQIVPKIGLERLLVGRNGAFRFTGVHFHRHDFGCEAAVFDRNVSGDPGISGTV